MHVKETVESETSAEPEAAGACSVWETLRSLSRVDLQHAKEAGVETGNEARYGL